MYLRTTLPTPPTRGITLSGLTDHSNDRGFPVSSACTSLSLESARKIVVCLRQRIQQYQRNNALTKNVADAKERIRAGNNLITIID